MRFGVLGETRAWRDGGGEVPLGGPARRALLALLLVRPGAAVPAGLLAEEVYGGEGRDRAVHAVQSQVSRLRAALRPDADIEMTAAGYRIDASPEDVDAWRFERLADEARAALLGGDTAGAAERLRAALGLWRGAAFADIADGVAGRAAAERLEERRLAALEDRIEADLAPAPAQAPGHAQGSGHGQAVVAELRELVGRYPLRERLRGLLMRALRAQGRPAEALVVFEETRRVLAEELGADPSLELAALHRELLRGERRAAPPAQLTSFVGRDGDVAGLEALLGTARLVTLTGPGGVGKTRLSVEVAARRETCFVELAPVDGPGVARALLGALGLREGGLLAAPGTPAADPVAKLTAALADRPPLLVLDNCEHVVEAVAGLAWRLLSACPDLRILATSREPLQITGEHLWPVRPLGGEDAVRLFADRAAAVRPGFAAGAGVRDVCRALDDLPLAIELAAARLRTHEIADLRAGLDDRFALLGRGSRVADARHRTLRSVVEWSWDLLTADEQRAARRLAVFAGGATAEAARRVCGPADVLESLADKSLVEIAGGRYRMLETIRAYGAERLAEAGEGEAARRAHAEYFLGLARTADPCLHRAEQLEWLEILGAEHGNLLAALRWAVGARDAETAFGLIGSMSFYLWIRGLSLSAAASAAALLELSGPGAPPGLEDEYILCGLVTAMDPASAQVWRRHRDAARAAVLARGTRRHPSVMCRWMMVDATSGDPRAALAAVLGDRDGPEPWARAAAHLMSGFPELAAGGLGRAEQEFGEAAAIFREVGDRWGTALALDALAGLSALCGDHAGAIALTDEALVLTEQLGAVDDRSDLLCNRGDYRIGTDPSGARADYALAAELARRAGSPTYLAAALRGLGDIALLDGDLDAARGLYEEALERFDPRWLKSVGNRTRALIGLGRVAEARGDAAEARHHHGRAIAASAEMGAYFEAARAVVALAGVTAAAGDAGTAARLLGAATVLRGISSDDDPAVMRVAGACREALGEAGYRAALSTGLRLSHEEAFDLAGVPGSAVRPIG
ncbi:ATP-binding protein [Actinomadura rubrisoli]|uniref:AfsR/SARP family transcriptional regulator n=1 Tax=Actinomadura rubrisoli TaxID=2530368 RepID=A0A4R5BPM9_9ACTN|nr:BTAD domain-containing putative transcriptional regulator [Actinomadura rubrisoli]TDD88858.1 AfsR/SARP family transcriptional regulator [Actinomadura rubrisoli]